ncbi:MAG: nucleotidyl transferase AbiEii/AbiGii toxin family protein [Anaerolineales bacterium]
MTRIEEGLLRLAADLTELGLRWALVGGLAVSARVAPRTTVDLDVVVAVMGDREAERIVWWLKERGYRGNPTEEFSNNPRTGRLEVARLVLPREEDTGLRVDLLFDKSGIEPQVIAAADNLELLPGFSAPVARCEHLLALKVLAAREKDMPDIRALLGVMNETARQETREALALIERLGYGRELLKRLGELETNQTMPESG